MVITPIKATIHYDDLKKVWSLKASREEVNGPNDVVPWKDLIEDGINLGQIIIMLLDWWASAGSEVNAPVGSMAALAALLAGRDETFIQNPRTIVPGDPEYPGSTFTEDPYDGTVGHWGTTAI